MMIDEMKLGEVKELLSMFGGGKHPHQHPYQVGEAYFIRTVTHHYTGRIVAVYDHELVMEDVAWIADDGRFADALKNKEFSEIEPYPDGKVVIGRGGILDACIIGVTPREQKPTK